jgi:O-antigen/teichoic acid export membrane protein
MVFALPVVALTQALLPRLIKQVSSSLPSLKKTVRVAAALVLVYCLAISIFLLQFGGILISLLGPAYSTLVSSMAGFCLLFLIYSLRCVGGTLLYAKKQPWYRIVIEASAIALLALCSAILVPRYGLSGALATAIVSETWICLWSWALVAYLFGRTAASSIPGEIGGDRTVAVTGSKKNCVDRP